MKTIYFIKNNVNNKLYVGQTAETSSRFKQHIIDSKRNPISMSWNTNLYKDMREFGSHEFELLELETVPTNISHEKEQYWIDKLNTLEPNGYNLTSGGELNKTYSEITKERIGQSTKERWDDPEIAKKMTEGLKKAGVKKGYQRVARQKRKCKECKNLFTCLITSDQKYCSRKCSLYNSRVIQKEKYVNDRKNVHEEIKRYSLSWAVNNKELVNSCPFNKIKSTLEPLFTEVDVRFDVKDYRVVSKAVSGKESRKELLVVLKDYVK